MKRITCISLLLFFSSALLYSGVQGSKSAKALPEEYKKWLLEDVVYIIAPKEKEVYLQLESDRERDIFIETFWKIRDPNPSTPENEFKEEHYQRINYANKYFGREVAIPGWRTDRGRIYIILGPPKDIERYEGQKQLYTTQIWTYPGDPALGLPPQFNVVFYQRNGVGDLVLYSPIADGPSSLIPGFMSDSYNIAAVYNQLKFIDPNVARVSLSLIPGSREQFDSSQRSFESDLLIATQIPASAYKIVETAYAEKLLRYKDIIEVEYTANYMDSDFLVETIRDSSGIFFVHYAIEPKKLSLEQHDDKFYATLEADGIVSDKDGNTIFQFQKKLPLELNNDQLENIRAKLFSYQDMFPLIPGQYTFSLLLKNTASKEFTSLEKNIEIPSGDSFQIHPFILAYEVKKNSVYRGRTKSFLVGDIQLVPTPRNDFALKDSLNLFFQIHGLREDLKEMGFIEYALYKEEEKVYSSIKKISNYQNIPNFLEVIGLSQFSPASYKVEISLLDENKNKLLAEKDFFYISYSESVPRPWILSQVYSSPTDAVYSNTLGNQLFKAKDLAQATQLLKKAYQAAPESQKYAYDYARILFQANEHEKIKEILIPFVNKDTNDYEFLALLGKACQSLEEYEEAIPYYTQYLNHVGANLPVLNSIGECHYRQGNVAEALVAWDKSLEINPDQEDIKKIVNSLRRE
jgi:GWxTD domain-containing protein